MKIREILTMMAAVAGFSAAAQAADWNFDGQKVPLPETPKMERAKLPGGPAPASAGLMPRRVVIMGKVKKDELAAMLRAAVRGENKGSTLVCSFAGPVEGETQVCGSECCDVDMDGDGEGDMTDCHLIPPCYPLKDGAKAAKYIGGTDCASLADENYFQCSHFCQELILSECYKSGDFKACYDANKENLEKCESGCAANWRSYYEDCEANGGGRSVRFSGADPQRSR